LSQDGINQNILQGGRIKNSETIYFKDSGKPVSIKAKVEKIITFSNLTPKKIKQILKKYAKDDGIDKNQLSKFFKRFKDKKYCLLIFLKEPKKIKPFYINKKGFGMMSAWLVVEDINKIKI